MKNKFILFIILASHILFAKNLTPVSLQLAWKYQFQFAGYIMAKEKGFYKDVGLDVKFLEYSHDKYTLDEVKKGNVQFGIGRSDLILNRLNQGTKFLQLLALCQAAPSQLQTIKKNGIEKLSDIKNKKLLVYNDEKITTPTYAMLNSKGISKDDIQLVLTNNYTLEDLTNGKTDIIVGYATITPYHLKKMGYEPIGFHPKDYGFDFYGDILFTMDEYEKENPKIVENFYKASIKGWKYAFSNIDETIDVIKQKYDSQKLSRDILEFEANEYKKLAFVPGVPFGDINPIKLEKIVNTFKLLGGTDSKSNDFSQFIYKYKEYNNNLTNEEKNFIRTNPIIRIGVRKNLYPIDFIDNKGIHKGISHDILDIISQKTGLRFIYIETKENEFLKKLNNKEISFLVSVIKNLNKEFINTKAFISYTKNILEYNINNNKLDKLNLEEKSLRFTLHKDSKILASILTKSIQDITKEQKDAIKNKWIPKIIKEKFDWTIIWGVLSIFSLIIIGLLYKNIQQRKAEKKKLELKVKQRTKELDHALDEKELLLKELNHRTKNNMQMILSLLRLQNDKEKDKKINDVIKTIQNRINAVSEIHEMLYTQNDLTQIDTYEYFEKLVNGLSTSINDNVEIELNINVNLKIEQAIYCGFMLNELITNSLKYAFLKESNCSTNVSLHKDKKNGKIIINLTKKDNTYILQVKDNGKGYTQNNKQKSLGLILIKRLATRQLDGNLEINSTNGVNTIVKWIDNE